MGGSLIMMFKIYTEKMHIENVMRKLEKDKPCRGCVLPESKPRSYWWNNPCKICQKFSGFQMRYYGFTINHYPCPCVVLGVKENVDGAKTKLKAMGKL